MALIKRGFFIGMLLYFCTVPSPFHFLRAQESLKTIVPDPQKIESTHEHPSAQKQPQITIVDAHFDVGEIYEGSPILHSFTVANTGSTELSIKDVKAG